MKSTAEVILVDEKDQEIGVMEKMEAHHKGVLHRAFSIFILNNKGEMLLQQRALGKYHNGGLWTNACCSHPFPGENVFDAANRRLKEEMGFSTTLDKLFEFTYKELFDNGLTEHEFDHVFIGKYDGLITPDPEEVNDFCYRPLEEISDSIANSPDDYTVWFKIAFPRVRSLVLST